MPSARGIEAAGAVEARVLLQRRIRGVGSAAACGNYGQIRENITNARLATKAYGGQ